MTDEDSVAIVTKLPQYILLLQVQLYLTPIIHSIPPSTWRNLSILVVALGSLNILSYIMVSSDWLIFDSVIITVSNVL